MRCWVLAGALTTCLACSAAAPTSPAVPYAAPAGVKAGTKAKTRGPAPLQPAPRPARPPAHLSREFTGQRQPSLLVENRVGTRQQVFIDWTARRELGPGASERFDLEPGPHTITCSDSADPDDNPASVTETFEAGFSYAYAIGQP